LQCYPAAAFGGGGAEGLVEIAMMSSIADADRQAT